MQGGRLKPDEKQSAKPRGGLGPLGLRRRSALLLTEAGTEKRGRGVGRRPASSRPQEPLDGLGPDADQVDRADRCGHCCRHSMRLHGFLRTSEPRRHRTTPRQRDLPPGEALAVRQHVEADRRRGRALLDAIEACIDESLAYERSRDDMSSSKERPGEVHHRAGETCPVLRRHGPRGRVPRYTVNYCATCQTGGKVLADNTTSKFLK